MIASNSGVWRVAGRSHLADGTYVASVFEVNTDSTDAIARALWKTPMGWRDTSNRAGLLEAMERTDNDLFPCSFETSIPLGQDLSSH